MKTAIIISSDHHIGSTLGLCPPRVELDDGGTYLPSDVQRWLWAGWIEFIEWARELSKGYKPVAIFNGDLGELASKHKTYQIITRNKATILGAVDDAIDPLMKWVDAAYFIRGTPAHVGSSSWLEEQIAGNYDNTVYQSKSIHSHYQMRRDFDGVRVAAGHHATMGALPWTEKDAANKVAYRAMSDYALKMHQKIPHLVIRSHNHRWADSFDNYETRAVCTACWCAGTEYVMRLGKYDGEADIGGVVVLCDGGKFEVEKFRHKPRKVNVWARA